MNHLKTVEIPATTKTVVDRVTCDMCGADIKEVGRKVDEVVVMHKTGTVYSDAGTGDFAEFDICGHCFDIKLVPWLKSQGAEPRVEPWAY